jgi:hypothetical protein
MDRSVRHSQRRPAGAEALRRHRRSRGHLNGKAVVDFQDGGWYDITASEAVLNKVDPAEGKAKYKNVNSAQLIPEKQG